MHTSQHRTHRGTWKISKGSLAHYTFRAFSGEKVVNYFPIIL